MSEAERAVCCAIQDYLLAHGGDSVTVSSTSPRGDGRWVPLTEVFPNRNARDNARRQTARRVAAKGYLLAYEIAFKDGCVKAVPNSY